MAISLITVTTLSGGSAATAREQSSVREQQFEELITEQNHDMPVAVRGNVVDTASGLIVMELKPPQSIWEDLDEGDSYPQIIVAATEVDTSGNYFIRLDPANKMLQESRRFLLTYYDEDGDIGGFGAGELSASDGLDQPAAQQAGDAAFGETTVLDIRPSVALKTSSSMAASDEGNSENEEAPPGELATDNNCDWFVRETGILAQTTVAVSGTNTGGAEVGAEFRINASSTLGFSSKIGSGSWIEGSGGYSVSNSSSFHKTWPLQNTIGTYSYRMQSEYREEELICLYTNPDTFAQVPVRYTGGSYNPVKWSNSLFPTHCAPQALGPVEIVTSTATKWNGGVKLGWPAAGSINVDSQSGYSTRTKINFNFIWSNRWLCGKNDVPGGTPGYLIADWKNR